MSNSFRFCQLIIVLGRLAFGLPVASNACWFAAAATVVQDWHLALADTQQMAELVLFVANLTQKA